MPVDEKTHNQDLDYKTIIKNMGLEIQKIHEKINNLKKDLPKDHTNSDACLIMVMQLEVATVFIHKLFESGLFDSINLDKTGFLYRPPTKT